MSFSIFAKPPLLPLNLANPIQGYFIWPEDIPAYAEKGFYSPGLVLLSYIIVTISAYVGLNIASKIPNSTERSRRIKLTCGALAIGAGIWAMHFIGMLAYQMRMLVTYDPWLTALSMVVAIIFSGAAFAVISGNTLTNKATIIAAPLLGLAVCSMHYIGMHAMQMDAKILYRPDLFLLSFLIAATTSGVALKLMFYARKSTNPIVNKIAASMVMGFAVCGMHYTGMMASVMLPYADCRYALKQDFSGLAAAVSLITLLIILLSVLVKQLDEAIAEIQQRTIELFQAQKMDAVGQLTGGIAHDFNNMLGVIIGNYELLQRLPAMPDRAKVFINTGLDSAKKASALTHRLLAFSRKQLLQPKSTDITALLPSTLILIGHGVGPSISIKTEIPNQLPPILVDGVQLESALLNLALNARDAMPDGGDLLIRAKLIDINPSKAIKLKIASGSYIALSVSDTGIGMTDEVKEKALEPFFTTKDIGKGSGMGLSMVSGFAQQSGGYVTLDSKLNKGTTVTIYLPVCSESPASIPTPPFSPVPAVRNENVLAVDDDKNILFFIECALQELGCTVKTTNSSIDALEILKETTFDLLITDILMPTMNGYALAEKAYMLQPQLKVLFISGYAQEKTLPDIFASKRCYFLPKPFSLDDLNISMEKLCSHPSLLQKE